MTAPTDQLRGDTPLASASAAQTQSSAPPSRGDTLPPGEGAEGVDFELSMRVARGAQSGSYERQPGDPLYRPLRIFALDPSASILEGAVATVNVPFEPLEPGPRGLLLQVVDDEATGAAAPQPVDLDAKRFALEQGAAPSSTDPAFRAQMVYAVCSTTHAVFRHALGREMSWGFDRGSGEPNRLIIRSCVEQTRNAYYDPSRGELRLGAFTADDTVTGMNVAKGRVYTALIHDIVVHEMSHALLDGLRARFTYPSNADVLAFHEAFADLVAIFQRFTYRDVVRAAIERTRGEIDRAMVLTDLGRQFAQTSGFGNALRSAILDTKRKYADSLEPHERGEVLVAAVFRAYSTIFQRKAESFMRLATNGTGVLPPGDIPRELADRLSELASKLAGQFLSIIIRAIDYCPPVDITFGEYLRAVITADTDLVADDPWAYREAWVAGFRAFDITPSDVPSLAQDALRWREPDSPVPAAPRLSFAQLRFAGDPGRPADASELRAQARALGQLVADPRYRRTFGLAGRFDPELKGDVVDLPQVESVRSSRRVGPDGQVVFDLVAEVTQRRVVRPTDGAPGFDFFGGSTVIVDPKGKVRYLIRKSVLGNARLEAQRLFLSSKDNRFWMRFSDGSMMPKPQGFRMVHDATRR